MQVRLVVAAAALVGLGIVPLALPAQADQHAPVADGGHLQAVPERPAAGEGWIQGKVLDRAKRPILNINVEAFKVGHLTGTPVSSSLTYAPTYRDERGWYRLYGLQPGKYKVRYSSLSKTKASYKTVWSKTITVGDRKTVELSAQTMTLQQKVAATLTASFADATVKPSQKAKLKITLTSPDVDPIAGDLYVKIDKQRAWKTPIKDANRGKVTVNLPKQALGKHTVAVRFGGNDAVKASTKASTVDFWVTRTGR